MIKEPRVLIVGERINTSRKNIRKAVEERNAAFVQEEARKQAAAGAGNSQADAKMIRPAKSLCLVRVHNPFIAASGLPSRDDITCPPSTRHAR